MNSETSIIPGPYRVLLIVCILCCGKAAVLFNADPSDIKSFITELIPVISSASVICRLYCHMKIKELEKLSHYYSGSIVKTNFAARFNEPYFTS